MDGQRHQTRAERMLEQGAFRRIWATYNDAAQLVLIYRGSTRDLCICEQLSSQSISLSFVDFCQALIGSEQRTIEGKRPCKSGN